MASVFHGHFSSLRDSAPPPFISHLHLPETSTFRRFSTSGLAVDHNDSDHVALVSEIFSKPTRSNDEISLELQSSNVVITHELVLKVLKSLNAVPDASRRFFDWVSATKGEKLSSKSYNLMLGILGVNGLVDGFWDLVDVMKKMGYGVSKGTQVKVLGKFDKEGMQIDSEKLKELYACGSLDNSIEKVSSRICKLIRQELWGEEVENRLRELNIDYSSDLVAMVLESLGTKPNKSLIFFRWVEESSLFKHDEENL
ncbi:pentatricopeptide repeat-containing protein At3g02490, mitochondrial-like [Impatiens glandulifera]|uniref:pentatricopeptide repeat-containing protein At3g02490, mitochondrial-like n=1 Tax=Impatiens glandulifera TaxID=253017 RepID=UPI001FB12DF3|nr:pentatricopeptide repeat-containing protein At3g02490, mitochondrial-like [Impatiens glandulifera]